MHIIKLQHNKKVAVYEVMLKQNEKSKQDINALCSNIIYYIIRTNTAWALYPVLLAVLFRSGCEVGNLNHSKYSCEKMCELLNTQLQT